jgi:hypothetical protein
LCCPCSITPSLRNKKKLATALLASSMAVTKHQPKIAARVPRVFWVNGLTEWLLGPQSSDSRWEARDERNDVTNDLLPRETISPSCPSDAECSRISSHWFA